MFVVFISTVKFHINAMYMGRVPVAEHDTVLPGTTSTAAKAILGGARCSHVLIQLALKNYYLIAHSVPT